MIARPSASSPTVTGGIWMPPSRRHVARTAFSCSRRNCCATAISIGILLLWDLEHGGGERAPSSPLGTVYQQCAQPSRQSTRTQSPSRGRQGRAPRRAQPLGHTGGMSTCTQGVVEAVCDTHHGLCAAARRATIAPCTAALVV